MPNISDIKSLDLESLKITFSTQNYIINSFVKELIASIFTVFIFIFTYIFMKRLEVEKTGYMNNKDIDASNLIIVNTEIKNNSEDIDNNKLIKNNKIKLNNISTHSDKNIVNTEEKNEL
jgi:hypothetical protein